LPFDWAKFFHDRVDIVAPAPLGGIERGGYRLIYTDVPDKYWKDLDEMWLETDLSYSLGVKVGPDGVLKDVVWDGPAFKVGLTVGSTIEAVNGTKYHSGAIEEAITAAKGHSEGIRFSVKAFGESREVTIPWSGGLRYPHLQRDNTSSSALDALLAARP
jgi:predicted metalloprotease with PDZ domain